MITALKVIPERICGSCNACCNAVGVEELGKPYYTNCEHQGSSKGCAIHGSHPASCKRYQCLWLTGNFKWEDRPDMLGAVIHCENDDGLWIVFLVFKAQPNLARIEELAEICRQDPGIRGVRFAKFSQVLNAGYPISPAYEHMPNVGEGTTWAQYETNGYWYLHAPKRIPTGG